VTPGIKVHSVNYKKVIKNVCNLYNLKNAFDKNDVLVEMAYI